MADVNSTIQSITKTATSSTSALVIASLIITVAATFVVGYILYWAINKVAVAKKGLLVPQTKIPVDGSKITKIDKVEFPDASNGKRATYMFWMYINDIDKYSGSRRRVMHIGEDNADTASPLVYMGANDNKLHVMFNPKKPDSQTPTGPGRIEYLTSKYGIVIDYIPINRWVHVTIVVNESVNKGTISAYLDAELVKVASTGSANPVAGTGANVSSVQNLVLDKKGAIYIGGSPSDAMGPGFAGLVSKVMLFNFDLNVRDIYDEYRKGPIDNLLAKLGLPAYGVQSPIYRIA
jgi:hypothetical protein